MSKDEFFTCTEYGDFRTVVFWRLDIDGVPDQLVEATGVIEPYSSYMPGMHIVIRSMVLRHGAWKWQTEIAMLAHVVGVY